MHVVGIEDENKIFSSGLFKGYSKVAHGWKSGWTNLKKSTELHLHLSGTSSNLSEF